MHRFTPLTTIFHSREISARRKKKKKAPDARKQLASATTGIPPANRRIESTGVKRVLTRRLTNEMAPMLATTSASFPQSHPHEGPQTGLMGIESFGHCNRSSSALSSSGAQIPNSNETRKAMAVSLIRHRPAFSVFFSGRAGAREVSPGTNTGESGKPNVRARERGGAARPVGKTGED